VVVDWTSQEKSIPELCERGSLEALLPWAAMLVEGKTTAVAEDRIVSTIWGLA
jgi:hypothetical protein